MKEIVKLIASDFGVVSAEPTQLDADTGIRYDFNCGARLKLPDGDYGYIVNKKSQQKS